MASRRGHFVIGRSDDPYLRSEFHYLKMGDGPNYVFYDSRVVCHFDAPLSAAKAVLYNTATITPRDEVVAEVASYAKRDLKAGQQLDGIGGYDLYGQMLTAKERESQGLLPIGLAGGSDSSATCVATRRSAGTTSKFRTRRCRSSSGASRRECSRRSDVGHTYALNDKEVVPVTTKLKKECRICGSGRLEMFLDLGETPLANAFLREPFRVDEPRYKLDVYYCHDCGLVQLLNIVPPETMFGEYLYVSSTSETLHHHFAGLAHELIETAATLAERRSRGRDRQQRRHSAEAIP